MTAYEKVRNALEEEADSVQGYLDGQDGAKNYLVGNVMQATGGSVDPAEAQELIDAVIDEESVEWPVTFTVYRRPVDVTTVRERLAGEVPNWEHDCIPSQVDDPTTYEFGFEVTVAEDGNVKIEEMEDEEE